MHKDGINHEDFLGDVESRGLVTPRSWGTGPETVPRGQGEGVGREDQQQGQRDDAEPG